MILHSQSHICVQPTCVCSILSVRPTKSSQQQPAQSCVLRTLKTHNKLTSSTTPPLPPPLHQTVVVPGYGWASGNSSTVCQPGFYNPGFNTRACTRCPGGLMTETTAANTSTACLAPAGYYYLRGKAIACAQGFFKPSLANADCTSCNLGWTTQFGAVAKTAATDCVCEFALLV